ncbi:hypothetical protein [Enterococcus mundtii]|uniref:hypothetical protein n=1 Tax=Enterococcus mundtii TaxID=53346 RepID=UPI002DBA0B27|nr:hypothetical protein [Enterococcus mundtii]MEC3942415.1 hypothetical protein [Enterococcus mundtii]
MKAFFTIEELQALDLMLNISFSVSSKINPDFKEYKIVTRLNDDLVSLKLVTFDKENHLIPRYQTDTGFLQESSISIHSDDNRYYPATIARKFCGHLKAESVRSLIFKIYDKPEVLLAYLTELIVHDASTANTVALPRVAYNCQFIGNSTDTLEFMFINQTKFELVSITKN